MRKKLHATNKRRVKHITQIIIPLFLLFCLTLVVLFCGWLWRTHVGRSLVSPLPHATDSLGAVPEDTITKTKTLLDKFSIVQKDISLSSDGTIHVILKDGQEVIIAENKSLDKQIASLQLILNRLTIEGRTFHRIDFRFDNPVVVF